MSALKWFDRDEILYTASSCEYPDVVWLDFQIFHWFEFFSLSKNLVLIVNSGISVA